MMETIICLLIVAAVLLYAVHRRPKMKAHLRLPGVLFSLEAGDGKDAEDGKE
jgi:hypothetical protein